MIFSTVFVLPLDRILLDVSNTKNSLFLKACFISLAFEIALLIGMIPLTLSHL
jgi:hypothetical protein